MEVARAPIIITGMHRSGTSLLARLLEAYGVFIGANSRYHAEASYFRLKNQWIYEVAHAHWDYPHPVRNIHSAGAVQAALIESIEGDLHASKIRSYLGWSRWLRYRGLENIDFPWGWKDPRNTYTLPLWMHIFPEALVVRVSRNGIDVAQSLRIRERRRLAKGNFLAAPLLSSRCLTLEGSFSLWAEHEWMAHETERTLSKERSCHLRFEDLVRSPARQFTRLVTFLGLPVNEQAIEDITASVNAARAYAFLNDQRLVGFYQRVKEHAAMAMLNYSELSPEACQGSPTSDT